MEHMYTMQTLQKYMNVTSHILQSDLVSARRIDGKVLTFQILQILPADLLCVNVAFICSKLLHSNRPFFLGQEHGSVGKINHEQQRRNRT